MSKPLYANPPRQPPGECGTPIPLKPFEVQYDTLSGRTFAGRYGMGAIIGKGGFGTVYKAVEIEALRPAAVKIFHSSENPGFNPVFRLSEKAARLAAIPNPNVVQIFDSGNACGQHYISMELMEGETLAQFHSRRYILPWDETRDIALQACEGLHALHGRGILHMDISPANIFMTKGGTVKIFDFDLAMFSSVGDDPEMKPTLFAGTMEYAAPEQTFSRRGCGPAVDVYALGVVVYQLLTDFLPYGFGRTLAKSCRDFTKKPIRLSDATSLHIPSSVEDVVMKAIERNPRLRFQSMEEYAEAIRRA